MARLERFEDIEAWKRGRELWLLIWEVTEKGRFARDFSLKDQIRRATSSITSNIAEGFERDGNKEFRQHLSQAKGSAGEVRSQLYLALDVGYITQTEFDRLYALVLEVSKLIGGFMRHLDQTSMRGRKFV